MEAQAAPAVPATQGFLRLSGWELDGERQPVSEVDVVVDSYPVVIGRECRGETLPNKISVSKSFMVSRHHLKLDWDEKQGNFTLEILGKNSVTVDRVEYKRSEDAYTIPLKSLSAVKFGPVCVYVLLPTSEAPRPAAAAAAGVAASKRKAVAPKRKGSLMEGDAKRAMVADDADGRDGGSGGGGAAAAGAAARSGAAGIATAPAAAAGAAAASGAAAVAAAAPQAAGEAGASVAGSGHGIMSSPQRPTEVAARGVANVDERGMFGGPNDPISVEDD